MRNKLDLRYNSAVSRSVQSTEQSKGRNSNSRALPIPLILHLHVMSLISPLLSPATVRVMTMCTQTSEGKMQECTGVCEKTRSSSAVKM